MLKIYPHGGMNDDRCDDFVLITLVLLIGMHKLAFSGGINSVPHEIPISSISQNAVTILAGYRDSIGNSYGTLKRPRWIRSGFHFSTPEQIIGNLRFVGGNPDFRGYEKW